MPLGLCCKPCLKLRIGLTVPSSVTVPFDTLGARSPIVNLEFLISRMLKSLRPRIFSVESTISCREVAQLSYHQVGNLEDLLP